MFWRKENVLPVLGLEPQVGELQKADIQVIVYLNRD
jgi:hypothetical protein